MMDASGTGPERRRRRWPLIGGLALAFVMALGVGTFLGATLLRTAQAAASTASGNAAPYAAEFPAASTPGAHGPGQCVTLTVSSVNGQTITAKAADGSTVTIHTTASTTYTKADQSATAAAVTVGAQIRVMGTHNSDGSITATSIDVV
jgi:hypothetical protein